MSAFSAYDIDLESLNEGVHSFHYELNDAYFAAIDADEVRRGNLTADVKVTVRLGAYDVDFHVAGEIFVTCDRCLDDMSLEVDADDHVRVKLGPEFGEEGDLLVLSEQDPVLNVAWFLYELIVLSIPIKHVHPAGGCNKEMAAKLYEHMAVSADEVDEQEED